ncbi:hypothetical protein HDU76_003905 [Blyttiomyces sp. JEL0837]|nr:hypothetical protein HDU76_003905 [Blyttiomyces sp. JEL0837]
MPHESEEHLHLILLLLHAKHNSSTTPFWPYVSTLPKTFTTPLHYETKRPDLWNLLSGTVVESVTNIEKERLQEVISTILLPLAVKFPGVISSSDGSLVDEESLWEDIIWAHTVIESRAFKVRLDPKDIDEDGNPHLSTILIPLGDLADHSLNPNLETRGVNINSGCLEIWSVRDINNGEELCLKYRDGLPNWALLTHYGFSLLDNPHDRMDITLDIPMGEDDDECDVGGEYEGALEVRKELIIEASEGLGTDQTLGPVNDPVSLCMLASLRILVATSKELDGITIMNALERASVPLSVRNERHVLDTVKLLAQGLLDSFTTSLEVDLVKLKLATPGSADQYTLIYLVGQKQILHAVLAWVEGEFDKLECDS